MPLTCCIASDKCDTLAIRCWLHSHSFAVDQTIQTVTVDVLQVVGLLSSEKNESGFVQVTMKNQTHKFE